MNKKSVYSATGQESEENFYDVMPVKEADLAAGLDHFCLTKTLQICRERQKGHHLSAAQECLQQARNKAARLRPQ